VPQYRFVDRKRRAVMHESAARSEAPQGGRPQLVPRR
jgi:hypothetical protein